MPVISNRGIQVTERRNTLIPSSLNPIVLIPQSNSGQSLGLDDGILDKHILLIGSTGTGKTNLMNYMVRGIKSSMTPNDVMIIFDTKGDFVETFFNVNRDVIIGNTPQYLDSSVLWNIFAEILSDGPNIDSYYRNAREISNSIFAEEMDSSGKDSFFPRAASDLFASMMSSMIKANGNCLGDRTNNAGLLVEMNRVNPARLREMLSVDSRFDVTRFYLGEGDNAQGLGVLGTMEGTVRSILQGAFAKRGDFSVRQFVRSKGARTLFVEYDLAQGSVLTPVYRLLIDLALKEALGRSKSEGKVYVVCDEFKLLPHLEHIDDAVNYGRSLGVRVIAGIQTVSQLYDNYGTERGKSIAAGFSTLFAFRSNDAESRAFVSDRFGRHKVEEVVSTSSSFTAPQVKEEHVVSDWDILALRPFEAIVGLAFQEPFTMRISLFRK